MILQTLSAAYQVANGGGNSTATSTAVPVYTSEASGQDPRFFALSAGVQSQGDGVVPCGELQGMAPNSVIIRPYGAGSSTNTFNLSVYGWNRVVMGPTAPGTTPPTAPIYAAWDPILLAKFVCTLNTEPGLANTPVNASQLFCGTITLSVGNANVSNEIVSPTGNVPAHIVLDVKGSQFIEFRYDRNSSATSCNALVRKM